MTDILGPASAPNAVTVRPLDGRSFGSIDSWLKNCTAPGAGDGTDFQAEFFNGLIAAMRSVARMNGMRADGVTPIVIENGADDDLLTKALQHMVQRGQMIFAADSGSANSIVATLSPAAIELKAGMHFFVLVAADNTGASKANFSGLGSKDVLRADGAQLLAGDLRGGRMALLAYNGTAFEVPAARGQPALAFNLTIYVRPDGNDANDGSANTADKAMLTPQGAINRAFNYGPGPNTVTIKLADGTFGPILTPRRAGPNIVIDGNAAARANVVLHGATGDALQVRGPNTVTCQNLKVTTGTPGNQAAGFVAAAGASLTLVNTESGFVEGGVHVAFEGSLVVGTHRFTANSNTLFTANMGGTVTLSSGATYTIASAISVGAAVTASNAGNVVVSNSPAATFVGAGNVTGPRYQASLNGIINTQGGGASYFPGNSAGTESTGGRYQ